MEMSIQRIFSFEFFIAFLLSITVVGLIFPYGFPIFFSVGILYFFVFFLRGKISVYINIGLILFYIIIILFLWGILSTISGLNSIIISSFSNLIILIIVLILYGNSKKNTFSLTKNYFFLIISFLSPLLAVFSLYKYILLLGGTTIDFIIVEGRDYPWGTSLMPDYNMFALGMIISLVAIYYMLKKCSNYLLKLYYGIGCFLVCFAIIFSGSRRGIIVLSLLIIYILIYNLFLFFRANFIKKTTYTITFLMLIIGLITVTDKLNIEIVDQYEIEKIKYRYSTLNRIDTSFDTRTDRWKFAGELIEEYDLIDILLGNGFNYHKRYGERYNVETGLDYPHNFFISTFFYSGVVGLIILILIIFLPFIISFKKGFNLKEEILLVYIISLIFFFVSNDTLLSINLLWLISSLFICTRHEYSGEQNLL